MDKEPTKEPWQPDWWFWIITAIIAISALVAMSNGVDNSGPACDLIRGC